MDGTVRDDLQTSEAATASREIGNMRGNEVDTVRDRSIWTEIFIENFE
jgi:hypothetical protein